MLGRGAEGRKELGRGDEVFGRKPPEGRRGEGEAEKERQRETETGGLAQEGQSGRAENVRREMPALALRSVRSRRGEVGAQGMDDTMEAWTWPVAGPGEEGMETCFEGSPERLTDAWIGETGGTVGDGEGLGMIPGL